MKTPKAVQRGLFAYLFAAFGFILLIFLTLIAVSFELSDSMMFILIIGFAFFMVVIIGFILEY